MGFIIPWNHTISCTFFHALENFPYLCLTYFFLVPYINIPDSLLVDAKVAPVFHCCCRLSCKIQSILMHFFCDYFCKTISKGTIAVSRNTSIWNTYGYCRIILPGVCARLSFGWQSKRVPVPSHACPQGITILVHFLLIWWLQKSLFSFPCLRAKLISFTFLLVFFLSFLFVWLFIPLAHISFDLLICSHCFLGMLYILDWVTICVASTSS